MKTLVCLALLVLLTATTASAQNGGFKEAVDKVSDAVVTIVAGNSAGAGLIVNSDGHVLTNMHVLGKAAAAEIILRNEEKISGKVVKAAEGRDLCLLKVERKHLPAVQFAPSAALRQGEDVAAIGAPLGLPNTVTKGVISATNRDIAGHKFLQIDAALNQGNSGGPVINQQGQVVGIATKVAKESESLGFAIPSDDIITFLNEAGITFATALGSEAAEEPAPAAAEGELPVAPQEPAPAAQPEAPLPASPLQQPWMILVLAAVVAFVVALVTALLVARSGPTAVPAPYAAAPPPAAGYAPPSPSQPRPAAPPASPPGEDLSDIDIELR